MKYLTVLSLTIFCLTFSASSASAQERTLKEFKEYVKDKFEQLDDHQLNRIASAADQDGDNKISATEFAKRMQVIQSVLSGENKSQLTKQRTLRKDKATPNPKQSSDVVAMESLTGSEDAPVLLITADEIATAWLPFAKWKTANGKLTKITTIGQIREKYDASNIQEKIRLCVRDHIDHHKTRWVILGGDCLPGGKGLVPGGHTTVHRMEPRGIPTDIVYLSPTNWDADDDGIYGEWDDDQAAISYPDGTVGLGRIPIRTKADIAAFTAKVIAYESNYPTDGFATNMIYTCTERFAYPKVRNSWDGYVAKAWDGSVGRFFSTETPWDKEDKPGSHDLSSDNLIDLINQKSTGKLHIHGHGHLPAWVLEGSMFTEKHAEKLTNKAAFPLITTVSCNTGEYDSVKDPSIVEKMLRVPDAGSVAVVAPIRTGKAHFADPADFRLMVQEGKLDGTSMTMTQYWVNGLSNKASTGHAMMQAKYSMAESARDSHNYHLCICELNLLGDPTLDMRSATPRTASIDVQTKPIKNKTKLTVNTDAPGCTVCVWNGKNVYTTTTADKQGNATVKVPTTSEVKVTVSGPNLNSTSKSVVITDAE